MRRIIRYIDLITLPSVRGIFNFAVSFCYFILHTGIFVAIIYQDYLNNFYISVPLVLFAVIVIATYVTSNIIFKYKEETMTPSELLGLVASLIEIANFAKSVTASEIADIYRARVEEGTMPRFSDEELLDAADAVADAISNAPEYIDRIRNKCLRRYNELVADHSSDENDIAEEQGKARRCLCRNIKLARGENAGEFPPGPFKDWWRQFECELLT